MELNEDGTVRAYSDGEVPVYIIRVSMALFTTSMHSMAESLPKTFGHHII
jgi:hypothetical protein